MARPLIWSISVARLGQAHQVLSRSVASPPGSSTRCDRLCLDIRTQNAPSRIAPTKVNTAHTASTFSFKAMSTSRASLTVDVKAIVTGLRRKPKQESCCGAHAAARKRRNGEGGATKYLTSRMKFRRPAGIGRWATGLPASSGCHILFAAMLGAARSCSGGITAHAGDRVFHEQSCLQRLAVAPEAADDLQPER